MLISFCQYIHVHLLNTLTLLAPTWRSTMSANVTLTCTTFKCTQVTQQTNKWKKQRNATYKQPNNQSCIDMILKWNDDYIKFCCCDVVPEAGLTYPSVLLQRILLINLKRHLGSFLIVLHNIILLQSNYKKMWFLLCVCVCECGCWKMVEWWSLHGSHGLRHEGWS